MVVYRFQDARVFGKTFCANFWEVNQVKRREWVSDNGVYKIVARHDPATKSTDISHRKLVNGKFKDIRHKDLPQYAKDKCQELYKEVNF
jgi:hypothetical protein